ncbi:MAG: amidohydrolase [Pseudomonadota bacterium]
MTCRRQCWPAAAVTLLAACTNPAPAPAPAAQVVLHGGVVHTVNARQPRAQALVIRGTRLAYVGDDESALALARDGDQVVDLDGKTVIPGLIDGHLHPVRGALKDLYQCNFPFDATPEAVRAAVAACVAAQPQAEWIIGGQWASGFFEDHALASPRRWLDAVSGDKAVVLSDDSLHNLWVNSRALELAGFNRDTPDPPGGALLREPDGSPNGVLLETAAKAMHAARPEYLPAQIEAAVRAFQAEAHRFGLTGIKGASTYPSESAALRAVDQAEGLALHVATSLRALDGRRDRPLDYDELETRRDRYASDHVDTRFVKLFLDGVPTPARTAAMLTPYLPDETYGSGFDGGPLLINPRILAADVTELDRRGFTVKMHAAGDRSVRIALDAIAAAREANGPSGLRHELAHAGYVSEADMSRFKALNAVADLSPILWFPSPIMEAIYQAVGRERGQYYFPVRDYLDLDAGLLAGSDWPAVAKNASPWLGIESLVTRRDPVSNAEPTLWAEQAITLAEALRIYTLEGARALRKAEVTGSLEPGKLADFLVLEEDPFAVPITRVSEIRPLETWFAGRRVFQRED